jgi:ubiquinone/menaquinone biosynthesis C-methylase UbiE
MKDVQSNDADYVLGRSSQEYRRLLEQAQFLRPLTERMLRAAGIGPGMQVLDVGCGVGDVSFLIAELVGSLGSVVGIDLDVEALAVAERRRADQALATVSFVHGDIRTADLHRPFDAAVGRLVLMYHTDPTATLRTVAAQVRPGGRIAFQEYVAEVGMSPQVVDLPLVSVVWNWMNEVFRRSGAHLTIGLELYWRMCDAGLEPHPVPLAEVPLDIGPESAVYRRYASVTRSLLPKIVEYGLASESKVGIDTLEERLREEILSARATIPLFGLLTGQWARKPSP